MYILYQEKALLYIYIYMCVYVCVLSVCVTVGMYVQVNQLLTRKCNYSQQIQDDLWQQNVCVTVGMHV